jgi:hypothetical protein
MFLALTGCGESSDTNQTGQTDQTTTSTATVNLVVTDTPATNLTVLSFQVQITAAVLQPGNVALLPRPVTVDLAQLVSDTGFLASTVIGSATYTSLEISLANPQVTLLNNTGTAITLAGQSCAAGATCTFSPALDNANVTISNGVFPLTITASSTTGLNLDLSIPDLLQSDLSVTLADGSSVNLSLLSGNGPAQQQARIDDVLGTVTAVSGSQVTLTTAFGDSLVLTESGSTGYVYPESVCSMPSASCVSTGQIVTADLSLLGDGSLGITSVSYVGSSGSPLVKALVLSTDTSGTIPSAQILLQREVNVPSLSAGQLATVSLPSGTAYSVGVADYPQVSMAGFASATDIRPGQELIISVGSDLTTGTVPSFSTSAVYLESSQIVGEIFVVDSAAASLEVTGLSGLFTGSRPIIQQMEVQTGTSTMFTGFNSPSLSAVSVGQFVVAKGPLFYDTGSGAAVVGAVELRARAAGN